MSNETEYIISSGCPSTQRVQTFDFSEAPSLPDEDAQKTPASLDVSELSPPTPEEQTSAIQLLPWELLDQIKKPTEPIQSEVELVEPTNTTPSEPAFVAQKNVKQPSQRPILKILKINGNSASNKNNGLPSAPRKNISIEIPPSVLTLLEENKADKKSIALFKTFMEDLPHLCSGRITLSSQDNTICVWNYDEGIPFSFFCIIDGGLFCGIESSLVQKEETAKTWFPPEWLFPEPVSFFSVTETTPMILSRIKQASLTATRTTTEIAL